MRATLLAMLLVFVMPVVFCVVDRFLFDYSIGPVVLLYSIASLLFFIPLFAWGFQDFLTKGVAGLAAIVVATLSGVIVLNVFIGLTMLFDIMDYELM